MHPTNVAATRNEHAGSRAFNQALPLYLLNLLFTLLTVLTIRFQPGNKSSSTAGAVGLVLGTLHALSEAWEAAKRELPAVLKSIRGPMEKE